MLMRRADLGTTAAAAGWCRGLVTQGVEPDTAITLFILDWILLERHVNGMIPERYSCPLCLAPEVVTYLRTVNPLNLYAVLTI